MSEDEHVQSDRTPNRQPASIFAPLPAGNSKDVPHAHQVLLKKVRALLDADRPKEALDLVNGRGSGHPALRNARGVCLMRMNQPALAVRALREITLGSGGVVLRSDVPVGFKINFATALLLSGNVSGCVGILDEICDDSHPRVQQLRSAIQQWKQELSWSRRLAWRFGIDPKHPVTIDFRPGEL